MENRNWRIVAVDFDGTLSFGQWPGVGPANEELFCFLKQIQKQGDKIILWTCRENKSLEKAVDWCKNQGLVFDAINSNLPEKIAEYGTDSRKIGCDYYIDDRAVSVDNFHEWREQYVRQGISKKNVEFSYL